MDQSYDSSGSDRVPKKELQGPRPTPLKVRKDSHKIKKPPVAPPGPAAIQQLPPQQQPPPRKPVIIYTVSPKVIHTKPSDFMTLVQRLTGPETSSMSSSASSSTSSSSSYFQQYPSSFTSSSHVNGPISPAARFASIEKTRLPFEGKRFVGTRGVVEQEFRDISGGGGGGSRGGGGGGGGGEGVERTVVFPGILSPGPGSLPQISPNMFSSYSHDPTTASYVPSPFSTSFISPSTIFSPSSLDLLHHILDS